mmetsp:Transcript_4820/g.5616  ORF Transcript_4820/g.5616 Transcript_4820/m.5616 type:complete len:220 (-) Transcript_4820:1158-1817(-)
MDIELLLESCHLLTLNIVHLLGAIGHGGEHLLDLLISGKHLVESVHLGLAVPHRVNHGSAGGVCDGLVSASQADNGGIQTITDFVDILTAWSSNGTLLAIGVRHSIEELGAESLLALLALDGWVVISKAAQDLSLCRLLTGRLGFCAEVVDIGAAVLCHEEIKVPTLVQDVGPLSQRGLAWSSEVWLVLVLIQAPVHTGTTSVHTLAEHRHFFLALVRL